MQLNTPTYKSLNTLPPHQYNNDSRTQDDTDPKYVSPTKPPITNILLPHSVFN